MSDNVGEDMNGGVISSLHCYMTVKHSIVGLGRVVLEGGNTSVLAVAYLYTHTQ